MFNTNRINKIEEKIIASFKAVKQDIQNINERINNLENKHMPYKSKAQEKYFNANKKKLEAQGVNVSEWNKSSKGKKLPARVSKKK